MADYYRNKFVDDLGQEFAEPMGFRDMSNVTPEVVIRNMKKICNEKNIPASIRESSVEISMGLFNKATFEAVEIRHPDPPRKYCEQLYVFFPQGIRFFYVGRSDNFAEQNNYIDAMNGSGGGFKAHLQAWSGVAPDLEPYEREMSWHESVYSAFCLMVE